MKIAVFGCSHTGSGPKNYTETWPHILYKKCNDIEVTNFAVGGTSTQFQYTLFKENIYSFDKFIFQFTNPYRLTKMTPGKKLTLNKENKFYYYDITASTNLTYSTPGRYNKEYKEWIKNDKGEILLEYEQICKEISKDKKCLFCFHFFKHPSNVNDITVLQNIFPNIIVDPSEHLNKKENKIIAKYIKETCKL